MAARDETAVARRHGDTEIRRRGDPVRRCIADLAEYSGPEDAAELARRLGLPIEKIVKLDANENPYGASPRVRAALHAFGGYHLYPDSEQREIREWIAEYIGLTPEYVMAGNGADELIDLLMRAYLDPGDELIDFPPSFGVYSFNAHQYDARVTKVERDDRFEIDVALALGAVTPRTKIVMLTSPNNPTGNLLPSETVAELLQTGCLVVLDEAYAEFSNESFVDWVPRYDNLVVLRTFSKWAGLAGLRIGYALLPPAVSRHLWKLKPPFNINQAAVVAVRESLLERDHLLANCRKIVAERGRLMAELSKIGCLKPYLSEANFILCDVLDRDAFELKQLLQERGILVRHYNTPRLNNCIRISVGTPEQDDTLLAELRQC
jgi:histidinol-phosphate aminotransferase